MVDVPVVGDAPGDGRATADENAMRSVPALKPKCVVGKRLIDDDDDDDDDDDAAR